MTTSLPPNERYFRSDRGLQSNRSQYVLYAKLNGRSREVLKEVREKMEKELGGPPSLPMMLDHLFECYLTRGKNHE